jgi:hypothetical protein
MACSICGIDGHNSKTCQKNSQVTQPNEGHVLWVKFDNITPKQADDLLKGAIDLKSILAPNSRGTFAKGTKSEMPRKISEALGLTKNESDDDQKKI